MTLLVVVIGIVAAAGIMFQHETWMRQRAALIAEHERVLARLAEAAKREHAKPVDKAWCRARGITWVPARTGRAR
jgi:Tfp pilus assembly protein PilV